MPTLRRIWVTRTRPQADRTAQTLRSRGFEPVVEPVLEARPRAGLAIDLAGVEAVAFTSGHAVRAFAALCAERGLRVFCVGKATAAAARAAGFTRVQSTSAQSGGGDVAALARAIAGADPKPGLLLNPTAAEPAADLGVLLEGQGVGVRGLAVYETCATGLAAAPAAIDAILIHSPKAARVVANLVGPAAAAGLSVFAISPAAAAPLQGLPFARLAAADRPDEASLLRLLAD